MSHWQQVKACVSSVALLALLAACGGSNGSSNTGKLNLSITDAPVDGAVAVVLTVNSASLEGVEGAADQGPFDVNDQFDLLSYQGTASRVLLVDTGVEAGTYKVRLDLDLFFDVEEPGAEKSYVAFPPVENSELCPAVGAGDPPDGAYRDGDGNCRYPLRVPSGEQAGFRPKGDLVINPDRTSSFTVEFDLRKNMVEPANADITYVLKPTGLRLVNDATVGIIRGNIDPDFFGTTCTPEAAKVYLYDLSSTPGDFVPDDIHDGNTAYVTSVAVEQVPESEPPVYRYVIGFVEPGTEYAVAMTCSPGVTDLAESDDPLVFVAGARDITVNANTTTVRDLNEPEDTISP